MPARNLSSRPSSTWAPDGVTATVVGAGSGHATVRSGTANRPSAPAREPPGHRYRHPVVGELTLHYESFRLPDAPDQSLVCQSAAPGSPDEEALRLLASWSSTAAPGRLERVNPQLR